MAMDDPSAEVEEPAGFGKRKEPSKLKAWTIGLFFSLTPYGSRVRLETKIRSLNTDLHSNFKHLAETPEFQIARQQLSRAMSEAATSYSEAGWVHLNAAKRAEVLMLPDETSVSALLDALEVECKEKLQNWRGPAALKLINQARAEEIDFAGRKKLVAAAMEIRDEHFDNLYRNKEIIKRHIGVLLIPMLLGAIGFMGVSFGITDGLTSKWANNDLWIVALGASFAGLMGASVSALTGMVNNVRVPNQFDHIRITLARAATGLISGLAAMIIVAAGWFNGFETLAHLWLSAFGFGFTEKLLSSAMDRLAK